MSHDLYAELKQNIKLLNTAIKVLRKRGAKYARAEHDYKVALSQQIIIERDNKVPVTIISDICRGDRTIARLRFERDVAEVTYKSALEAINAYKLQIRIIENQLQREWGNTNHGV